MEQQRVESINGWRMIYKVWLVLLFAFLVLLAACEQVQPSPTTPATYSPSATNSPIPTRTQTITSTPTATQIVILPSSYDLPDWMGDPDIVILANSIMRDEGQRVSSKLSFLNAFMGEWYDMQIPAEARRYFWFDNMHFGFLSNDLQLMYLIDLNTGRVESSPVSQRATRLLESGDHLRNLEVKQDPLSPDEFIFDYVDTDRGANVSRDTRYIFEWGLPEDEDILVREVETGQIVWRSKPHKGYFYTSAEWSPKNDSYLAIVEGRPEEPYGLRFPVVDTSLIVIDVQSGKVISSYKGDIGPILWSPDGTMLLYKDANSVLWNFGYAFEDAPCIFNIETGENKCIWNIPNSHIPNGYSLETTSSYQWSPDGQSIYYIYFYGSTSGMAGNICMYDLLDGSITCPTDDLTKLPDWNVNWPWGWAIGWYDFSPDEKLIHFCYSSNSLLSDDQTGPSQDGLINIDGTKLISWAGLILGDTPKCSYGGIWRPLP